ncbi:putative GTPase [Betaproteobacteria bacterium MOLA814]|jgi:LAO/AO transport system kinase|nr:putative GTPase [Betaproteobacteria bacterium MOLA814]
MSALLDTILVGQPMAQRRAMAKAITLLESTRTDHRAQADDLLTNLLAHSGSALRIGMSGVPGVGKSTFIEVLGLYLIAQGLRVAVLAVDPSSTVSGGSILGDKTRMEYLSVHPQAFIRPSPSSGTLGGVTEKTREAMLVCEAAGYDVVIVETVGVGQSETAVASMTDMFVLLQLPNAGDDLQAIKKGVMELADLVVINKADIDGLAATRAQAQISSALRMFGLHGNTDNMAHSNIQWQPTVMQMSALMGTGVPEFWELVQDFKMKQKLTGRMAARRASQAKSWMWERIQSGLIQAFTTHAAVREQLDELTAAVVLGHVPASVAARQLLTAATRAPAVPPKFD